ncbi:MAG: 3-hydroxyacyl-CoA dehydrogenase family protein [Lunatimonas sp.]|uniref:3-hydroxyacyl-CoA dehydrogenase family protein n=1 Tax=Lunatimonas sp. TaxID=2060141 RepID=UPI00263AE9B7|nr:3-hydroxyacyl-CoA dehydrogenase family protein [Lunatimonas sp.]MCC5938333.1 3-hydroxyacyl-CoA dehydrogenase family protein [Lunatimonas sp.]
MIKPNELAEIELGVVGLGLMGSSIVVALLIAGHPVRGVAPIPSDMKDAELRITKQLKHAEESGILNQPISQYLSRLMLSEDFGILRDCRLVQECVVERTEIKGLMYRKIAEATRGKAIVSSNTSAIPISVLQDLVPNPERFLGVHWAEPAYLTRFLEITKGAKTAEEPAKWVFELAHYWDKEPTFLQKDIRGFVTNRLMYAVYREAFHLIDRKEATVEDVDKSFRYDAGSWITAMGLMKRMDLLGLADFRVALSRLFPELSNSTEVPELMKQMVEKEARGIQNARGLYAYTEQEAEEWEKAFAAFNKEIYRLAAEHPSAPTEK